MLRLSVLRCTGDLGLGNIKYAFSPNSSPSFPVYIGQRGCDARCDLHNARVPLASRDDQREGPVLVRKLDLRKPF